MAVGVLEILDSALPTDEISNLFAGISHFITSLPIFYFWGSFFFSLVLSLEKRWYPDLHLSP